MIHYYHTCGAVKAKHFYMRVVSSVIASLKGKVAGQRGERIQIISEVRLVGRGGFPAEDLALRVTNLRFPTSCCCGRSFYFVFLYTIIIVSRRRHRRR